VLLMNIHFGAIYLTPISLFHPIPKNPTSITPIFVMLIAYNSYIFAQGDNTAAVRKSKLLFLWGMVNNVHFDSGAWWVRQFTKGKVSSRKIAIGGFIMTITLHFNIPLEDDKPISGTSHIDLDMLINNDMLVKRDG